MPGRIEDYALIGDGETAALVGRDGSIDWLCWPRFDSDACFAALLGGPEHGRCLIAPDGTAVEVSRSYRGNTLILDTRFRTPEGEVVVTDFMPPRGESSELIRLVRCERGRVPMYFELVVRFGYGANVPWVTHIAEHTWRAIAGPDMLVLHTAVPDVHGEDLRTVARFTLEAGETASFALCYAPSHEAIPPEPDVQKSLQETESWWLDWVAACRLPSRYAPALIRSLITLRALIYAPTGGIIAAPTTSLPEAIGSERNWDYRYCWLRDATMTLLALMDAGYFHEAAAWRDWLLRAVAGSPNQIQIMYGIAGERRLVEWEIPWLPGYENSRPVRIGNAASDQLQLDVYGEIMDVLHQARKLGKFRPTRTAWSLQLALLDHLEKIWEQPDYGIWEVRGPPRHFTYSKIMCWVAFDRGVRDAEQFCLEAPVERWREIRDRIHAQVCERAFNPKLNSFVQSYDADELDASLLLMAELGFLPPDDPRFQGTIAAIERGLMRNGLVYRYDTWTAADGLPPGEGAFLACTFWLADAYALCGRYDEAHQLFERLLALRNDVGLLAEEYDPVAGRMLGNFPQGFSHLALVNTAYNLAGIEKPAEQRADGQAATG